MHLYFRFSKQVYRDQFKKGGKKIQGAYNVINHASKKQRNLIITLLDLKIFVGRLLINELITYVLKFLHVPDHIIQLTYSLYTDYRISIATHKYLTLRITDEKGVLQGDSLSLLL